MKKFKPMKVKNSSIRLPDEFLDNLLINDGDFLVVVEDNGRFYLRKTFASTDEEESNKDQESSPPPPSIDEMMKKAQSQFSEMPNLGGDFMKTIENTLNNPEMMKKIQDMAKGMFKGFVTPEEEGSDTNTDEDDPEDETDEEDDENTGYKIDID